MNPLSIFDIFKIGVGPSSSHTLGPWRAALHFVETLEGRNIKSLKVQLFGSLSKTGKGHATDKAVLLGLQGYDPITMDTDQIDNIIADISVRKELSIHGRNVSFDPEIDLIFEEYEHIKHPNTVKFTARTTEGLHQEEDYMSVGGGFIELGTTLETKVRKTLPFPINKGADLVQHTQNDTLHISEIVAKNELVFRNEEAIEQQTEAIIEIMLESVFLGCTNTGVLPGGLNVQRRANKIINTLTGKSTFANKEELFDTIKSLTQDFVTINKVISCFAIAVNEQNASLSRVVTSPTNGAAGVIPAAMLYFMLFCDYKDKTDLKRFLYTAGEIGCLFKKNATISAAVGGCQAEIGVSSSMAAAALTELKGGTALQCLMAAEIAMEHHLGLTCDPIGGLVQAPCIERNAMGVIKAITAANLAMMSNADEAIVKLDEVIETMWQTAQDMDKKYKETSEGGLAKYSSPRFPNC